MKSRLAVALVALVTSSTFADNSVRATINLDANPCEDFFEYVCRPWIDANPVPADQGRWGTFDRLAQTARQNLGGLINEAAAASTKPVGNFYRACMDEKAIEARGVKPLHDDLAAIGAIDSQQMLMGMVARMHRDGASALFSFAGRADAKDATRNVAYLDQSGLGMPDRDYYLQDDPKSKSQRDKYREHLTAMFRHMGVGEQAAGKRAQAVLDFEIELAKTHMDKVVRRIPERTYNRVERKELTTLAGKLPLEAYFKNVNAPAFDWLVVTNPDGLKALATLIDKTPMEDIKHYLMARSIAANAGQLPKRFVEEQFNFFEKELTGAKAMKARERQCIEATDRALPDLVGQLYVEKHFGKQAKQRMDDMVKNVVNSFGDNLSTVTWMSPETRIVAKEKADGMAAKIGYPDKWRDYSKVAIGDSFVDNHMQVARFMHGRAIARIGQPVDKTEWFMSAPTVNAFYNGSRNDINFPAGILQPPFFDLNADDAINYGAIGSVIGHEISHGFDDRGRKFDKNGNLTEWWKKEDAQNFEKAAQCVVDQYGGYTAIDDVKLNGKLTLGENIADLGGVRVSYKAYLATLKGEAARYAGVWCSQYRPEMARLRALTDSHSAPRWRVNGVVSNMPEFAQAFQCKPGQGMVRENQCRVW
jgi:putative endopeptidase